MELICRLPSLKLLYLFQFLPRVRRLLFSHRVKFCINCTNNTLQNQNFTRIFNNFEFSKAAVLMETLSAPRALKLLCIDTELIPPPTVKGINILLTQLIQRDELIFLFYHLML